MLRKKLQFFYHVDHFLATFDHFFTKNHDPGNTGLNTGILSMYPGIPVCTPVLPGMLATQLIRAARVARVTGVVKMVRM